MKITVKNFGPIREAKNVEIGPMTIFVGPSNTGKSYLAMLIYSIHEVLADDFFHWGLNHPFNNSEKRYDERLDRLRHAPKSAIDEIKNIYFEWAQAVSDAWKKQMVYCFGEEGKKLIEENSMYEDFSVKISDLENQISLDLCAPKRSKIVLLKCRKIYDDINIYLPGSIEEIEGYESDSQKGKAYIDLHRHVFHESIFRPFQKSFLSWKPSECLLDAYYLPAVRGGIMQSHRTLVSTLIERVPVAGLTDTIPIPLFNGVLSDFMMNLIRISSGGLESWSPRGRYRTGESKRHVFYSQYQDTLDEISNKMERDIVAGQIEIERSEAQYPDFRYKFTREGKKYDLPLMSASSSVSELAPISLFIRHYLCPNDLFVVEEPEAHLHPGAQREISEVLVKLVNVGVNVLVTTHSDNILEQISNYIYADRATASRKTRLRENKCKTYRFKSIRNTKRTKVEAVSFDPETGIVTEDHLKVSSDLYNETVQLMEQCEDAGSKTDI